PALPVVARLPVGRVAGVGGEPEGAGADEEEQEEQGQQNGHGGAHFRMVETVFAAGAHRTPLILRATDRSGQWQECHRASLSCHLAGYPRHMLRSVAVIAMDQVAAFELGVLAEVFGTDRTADDFPGYRFDV